MTRKHGRSASNLLVAVTAVMMITSVLTGTAALPVSGTPGPEESALGVRTSDDGRHTIATDCSDPVINTSGIHELQGNITGAGDEPCLFINSSDVVLDGNGYTIATNGSGGSDGYPIAVQNDSSIDFTPAESLSNVTIRNVRVVGWSEPIEFTRVNNVSVRNVTIDGSGGDALKIQQGTNYSVVDTRIHDSSNDGIDARDVDRLRITGTTITDSGERGILLDSSSRTETSNHTIRDNTLRRNAFGITGDVVVNATIANNTIRSVDKGGASPRGLSFDNSRDVRITDNTVVGRGDGEGVFFRQGTNNTLVDNTLRMTRVGVRTDRSDIRVANNTVRMAGLYGVQVADGRAEIRNNLIEGGDGYGVFLQGFAENVTIEENTVRNLTDSGAGVGIVIKGTRITVSDNLLVKNRIGVKVAGSGGSGSRTVTENDIVNNSKAGVEFGFSAPATVSVSSNVIAGNGEYGINNRNDDIIVRGANNWWGAASGPSSPPSAAGNLSDPSGKAVANGAGDAVSARGDQPNESNVAFDPWLRSPSFSITTDRLARSELRRYVSHQLETARAEPPIQSFSVVNGSLPRGMVLFDDGSINGTPLAAGNFTFTVRAVDGNGNTANRTFTKRVSATVPPPAIRIDKEGGRAVPGRKQLYVIKVTNTGSTIARNVSVDEFLEPWFTLAEASPAPDTVETRVTLNGSEIVVNDTRPFGGNLTRTTVTWEIGRLDPGESRLITYQARLDEEMPEGFNVTGEACVNPDDEDSQCYNEFKRCKEDGKAKCDNAISGGLSGAGLLKACVGLVTGTYQGCAAKTLQTIAQKTSGTSPCEVAVDAGCEAKYQECQDKRSASQEQQRKWKGFPTKDCDEDRNPTVNPEDPNEKIVAADRFVRSDETLPYAVRFENVGNASARNVTVTDRLPEELDLSTLEVLTANRTRRSLNESDPVTLLRRNKTRTRNVTIGNETVRRNETVLEHHTVTLRNRTVRWHLENIDLAPNATGTLLLSVDQKQGVPNGTRIENNATIRFDDVSSLTTNDTVNIVDDTTPACRVESLPASSPRSFTLRWTGSDAVGRIDEVDILASTDGETWETAVSGLGDDSVTFDGNLSKTYRFMCLAEDVAGNRETQTPSAEAATTVTAVDVNGTVREADGDPAANDTVAVADASRPDLGAAVFNANGLVVCGLFDVNRMRTDASGRFSFTTEANVLKDLTYYQAHPGYFMRTQGSTPAGTTAFPRDGSPDLYGLSRVNASTDRDLGTVTLPSAHPVNVTVVTEDGTPVENASVVFVHTGPDGAQATGIFPDGTDKNGVFVPNGSDSPGLELTGNVSVAVRPPGNQTRFVNQTYSRNLTVDTPKHLKIQVNTTSDDPADTTPPTVTNGEAIDRTDRDGTVTDGDLVEVRVNVTDADSNVARVDAFPTQFGVESVRLTDTDGDGFYNGTFRVTGEITARDGFYPIELGAIDEAGNTANGSTNELELRADDDTSSTIVPYTETKPLGIDQVTPDSLAGKITAENGSAANVSVEMIRNSSMNYSLAITAPEGTENVTFYLQSTAISASRDLENLTMYLDAEEHPFVVNESAGPGDSSWVAFNVPHFSTRTVTFTAENATLSLRGGSVSPETISESTTVTHDIGAVFENVSQDGNTDQFYITVPDAVAGPNLSIIGVNVTDLSTGSEVSITSSPSLLDGPDDDGVMETVTFAVSPDGTDTMEVMVNASVVIAWPAVKTDTPYEMRAAGTDSTTGSVSLAVVDAVTVIDEPGPVDRIKLTPAGNQTVTAGDTKDFSAAAYDSEGTLIESEDANFTWSAEGGSINTTGFFDETTAGTYTLTVEFDGVTNTTIVSVEPGPVDQVDLSPGSDQTITAGNTIDFDATAYDSEDNVVKDEDEAFTWDAEGGSISGSGVFDGTTTGTYNVTAELDGVTSNATGVTVDTSCIDRAVAGSDEAISLSEIQRAINWWAEDTPVPDTGGETISLSKIQALIDTWAEDRAVSC